MLNRTHGLKLLNKSLKPLNIASRRFRHIRCCQGRTTILHLSSLASASMSTGCGSTGFTCAHTFGTDWATEEISSSLENRELC